MKKTYTDKTGGFLMEIDCYYDELRKFTSDKFKMKYMFKDPEVDSDADTSYNGAYAYMKNYINTFETELRKTSSTYTTYKNYLDIDSAIWFMFINEMANNSDFFNTDGWGRPGSTYYGPHSTYLYKDAGKKMFMGPVWDFDYGVFVPRNQWIGFNNSNYYYTWMCKDPEFVARLKELWEQKKDTFLQLTDYIDDMAKIIRLSEKFNTDMWGYNGTDQSQNGDNNLDFDQAIERIKKGFKDKVDWMDEQFEAMGQ
jgi:hypothetical protein